MNLKISLAILLTFFLPPLSFSSEADFRFADGLLERQMFESLEYFCNAELKSGSNSLADKYAFAAQLVRSRTVQMLAAGTEKRQNILDILTVLETQLSQLQTGTVQPADELAALLFQLQIGIAYLTLGEELSWELELLPLNEQTANIETARKTLQTALEKLRENSDKTQLLRNRTSQNADLNFSHKIDSVVLSFTYQIGTAQVALAKTFNPPDSGLLKQSVVALYPAANLQSDSPVVFQCKIKLAQCYRLLSEKEKYDELLKQLNAAKNNGDIQFQTELLRYYILTGNTKDILPIVLKGRADSAVFPEYDLARLEILLHYSEPDETAEEKKQREDAVLEIAGSLEHNAGFYWGRRARSIIAGTVSLPNAKEQSNPAMLAALAEEQFHRKKYADAAQLFEQAERAAQLNGSTDDAFKYGSSAVGVLNSELENNTENTDKRKILSGKLRAFALRNFARKDAAEYHLKAIDLAAQEIESRRIPLDDYITLLKEHTATWTASPKTPPLLLRTAVLLAKQNKCTEALAVMEKIPSRQAEFMGQLSEEECLRIEGERSRQAAKSGKTQEAVNILTELLKKQPAGNTDNWISLADILSEQPDKNSLTKALTIWMKIQQEAKDGTKNWWTAREKIIEVLVKLGRKDEAVQSFDVLKVLYPDMDAARKDRLEKLLNSTPRT